MAEYGNGAKLQEARRASVADIVGRKTSTNTSQKVEVEEKRDANIQSNAFYKVIFDPNLAPDVKQKEVASILSEVGTKEQNREKVQQLEQIKEYLQLQRENMASRIIAITDTGVVARLQQVYNDMNSDLNDFNDAIKPILDIVAAMNTVRTEGKGGQLFAEIRDDRNDEKEFNSKKAAIENRFNVIRSDIENLRTSNDNLGTQKTLFGFGGVKAEAQQQIATNDRKIIELTTELDNLATDLTNLQNTGTNATKEGTPEYLEAKKTIRNMLDLSADEHRENQKKSVEQALKFIKTSKTSLNDIKGHLTGLNGQIDNLTDANHTMITAYAILGEGTKEAEKNVVAKRNEISTEVEGESMIVKMDRDEKLRVIDEHTTMLSATAADTELTFADLNSAASRIRTMKDSNKNQMDKVQKMATAGVAGTADRLSVVLQAVGAAALGESSEIARETLTAMNDTTNEIALRETMRVAYSSQDINSDIQKAMEDLAAYGEVTKVATEITTQSMSEARQGLEQLKDIATSLQADLKEQGSIASKTAGMVEDAGTVVVTPSGGNDPFKL